MKYFLLFTFFLSFSRSLEVQKFAILSGFYPFGLIYLRKEEEEEGEEEEEEEERDGDGMEPGEPGERKKKAEEEEEEEEEELPTCSSWSLSLPFAGL